MTTKVCTKCGVEKELGEYYTYFRKGVNRVYVQSACKPCHNKRVLDYRNTEHGRSVRVNYEKSEKYKDSVKKYQRSEKYKTAVEKHNLSEKRKRSKERYKKSEAYTNQIRKRVQSGKAKEASEKFRINLRDGYVSGILKRCNIPITPETIELKRTQIKLKRIIRNHETKEH